MGIERQDDGRTPVAAPPRNFPDLRAMLTQRMDRLPKRLRQAAEFAIARPDEIAFGTAARVASAALVHPSTLVRLAQQLGYEGFSDLQIVFQERFREPWPSYGDRIASLREADRGSGIGQLLETFVEASTASLAKVQRTMAEPALDRAVATLEPAGTIYLLGLRRAFPVAAYLAYAMGKLGIRSHLIDHAGGLAPEQALGAAPSDALIAISFTPYTPLTVELATAARRRKVPVVALTDSPFSPLVPLAEATLEVAEADASGFRSLAATFAVAMTLAVAVAGRRSDAAAAGA